MTMSTMAQQLENLKYQPDPSEYDHSVLRLLNERYSTWDDLVRLSAGPSGSGSGSRATQEGGGRQDGVEGMQEDGWDLDVDEDDMEVALNGEEEFDKTGLGGTALQAEIQKWRDVEMSSTEAVRPDLSIDIVSS